MAVLQRLAHLWLAVSLISLVSVVEGADRELKMKSSKKGKKSMKKSPAMYYGPYNMPAYRMPTQMGPSKGKGYPSPSKGKGYPVPSKGKGYPAPSKGKGYPAPNKGGNIFGNPVPGPTPSVPSQPMPAYRPYYMRIRSMTRGGMGNFFPRVSVPSKGTNDSGLPFGIWPRIVREGPTAEPSAAPTLAPVVPTSIPTTAPITPTFPPSSGPTIAPVTALPTSSPTAGPTAAPSAGPTIAPSTATPTATPTFGPTLTPGTTNVPTTTPTSAPTGGPTIAPTGAPTSNPTSGPTTTPLTATAVPTSAPSSGPTTAPVTATPTAAPVVATDAPTGPTTSAPTALNCTADDIGVAAYILVDSENDIELFEVMDGDFLDFDVLEETYGVTQFTIVCNTTGPVRSAILTDNFDQPQNLEGDLPFALADDNNGDFGASPFQANPGEWNVTCQPFCGEDQTGAAGEIDFISFNTSATDCSECVEGCIDVVDFVLVNANTNVELRSIVRDEEFSLAALQTEFGTDLYTIICITDPAPFASTPFAIGSTILYDTYENVGGDNERNPPYALDGDDNNNFTPINFRTGPWLVSCEAFCGVNFDGIRSPLRNITFSVVA